MGVRNKKTCSYSLSVVQRPFKHLLLLMFLIPDANTSGFYWSAHQLFQRHAATKATLI